MCKNREILNILALQRKMRYSILEVISMEKTMTLNLRVNPTIKKQAEDVLKQLGIPMATAVDMYLRQIILTEASHFLSLPKAPPALNMDTMTDEQLHAAFQAGLRTSRRATRWTPGRLSRSFGKPTDEAVSCQDLPYRSG